MSGCRVLFDAACVILFCATMRGSHYGAEHSQNHSPLCVWSCQTNNVVSLVSLAVPLLVVLVLIFLVSNVSTVSTGIPRSLHFPCGPLVQ